MSYDITSRIQSQRNAADVREQDKIDDIVRFRFLGFLDDAIAAGRVRVTPWEQNFTRGIVQAAASRPVHERVPKFSAGQRAAIDEMRRKYRP